MTTTNSESRYRILVIDDSPLIHTTFRRILGDSGRNPEIHPNPTEIQPGTLPHRSDRWDFEVDGATRGEEGYELVRRAIENRKPYALAIVDMVMPGWDGIQTVLKLWEVDPDIQVVICTALTDYSWDEVISRTGHSDRLLILKKPLDAVEVMQLAHALTEKWRLLQLTKDRLDDLEKMVGARTVEARSRRMRSCAPRLPNGNRLRPNWSTRRISEAVGLSRRVAWPMTSTTF